MLWITRKAHVAEESRIHLHKIIWVSYREFIKFIICQNLPKKIISSSHRVCEKLNETDLIRKHKSKTVVEPRHNGIFSLRLLSC